MKKGGVILVVIFSLILLISLLLTIESSMKSYNRISGKATTGPLNVSITVAGPPNVNILNPVNFTYNNYCSSNLELRFSISGGIPSTIDTRWYSLDNIANVTVSGFVNISISGEGNHTLRFYANNTAGAINDTEIVYFTVNNSFRYNISYAKYSGSTTNFNSLNKTQFWNISDFTLDRPSFGKIVFQNDINFSVCDANLDEFTEIKLNYIAVNSSFLPVLNKSTNLSLYGLSFSNPRILRSGSVCSSNICQKIIYNNGNLTFNVTQFTWYSAEETPSGNGGGTGGGGGGSSFTGAIASAKSIDIFNLGSEIINISLRQNENVKQFIQIQNNKKEEIEVEIDLIDIREFVTFATGENVLTFKLRPDEKKTIQLIFSASTGTEPGLYNKIIKIRSGTTEKLVNVIISVESEKPLFDVLIEIANEDVNVNPGGKLRAQIKILNLFDSNKLVDVDVHYEIRNADGNSILTEHETRAIDREVSYIKIFNIPKNIKSGDYILYVKVTYNGVSSGAFYLFNVEKSTEFPSNLNYFYGILFFMIFVIIFILLMLAYFEYSKIQRRKRAKIKKGI